MYILISAFYSYYLNDTKLHQDSSIFCTLSSLIYTKCLVWGKVFNKYEQTWPSAETHICKRYESCSFSLGAGSDLDSYTGSSC